MIAPILFLEVSTIFLNAMWLLRTFGMTASPAFAFSKLAFVASFFVVRVVLLPLYIRHLKQHVEPVWTGLAVPGRGSLLGLCAMQFYWFAKIVRRLTAHRGVGSVERE